MLRAVQLGFMNINEKTTYDIHVYKNLKNSDDPESGTEIANAHTTGEVSFQGEYTVKLANPVRLKAGETYSIVVTTNGGCLDVSADYEFGDGRGYSNVIMHDEAKKGQSFMGDEDNDWFDMSEYDGFGNIHIRPLTDDAYQSGHIENLQANLSRDGKEINLSWNIADGTCEGYEIMRSLDPYESFKSFYTIDDPSKTKRTDKSNIQPATDYYYKVCPIIDGKPMEEFGETVHIYTGDLPDTPDAGRFIFTPVSANYDGNAHGALLTTSDDAIEIRGLGYSRTYNGTPGTYSETIPKDAGVYTMCAYVRCENVDYKVRCLDWTYEISRNKVTVSPDAITKDKNAVDPELTYTYYCPVQGETPGFKGRLVREKGKTVGDYRIMQGSLALSDNSPFLERNYVLEFKEGAKFTIIDSRNTLPVPVSTKKSGEPVTDGDMIGLLVSGDTAYDIVYTINADTPETEAYKKRNAAPICEYKQPIAIRESMVVNDQVVIKASTVINTDGTLSGCVFSKPAEFRYPYVPEGRKTDEIQDDDIADAPVDASGNVAFRPWIGGLPKSVEYTGMTIKCPIRVYDGTRILKQGRDYSVKYANNKNVGTATVTVKGKGHYASNLSKDFEITPADISGNSFHSDWIVGISGKTSKTEPILYRDGKKLKKNSDYKWNYYDQNGSSIGSAPSSVGDYLIGLQGEGNYGGARMVRYTIVDADSEFIISKYKIQGLKKTYSRSVSGAITPDVTVKGPAGTLREGEDYTVSYANNTGYGTAYVIITGAGKFVGSKTAAFKIKGGDLRKATLGNFNKNPEYTGSPILQEATLALDGVQLVRDKDYKISYSDNINAGTAKVTYSGLGIYAGSSLTKTFRIKKRDINTSDFVANAKQSVPRVWRGIPKPAMTVAYGDKLLVAGRDYSFKGVKDGDGYNVIIKGKGNYTGTVSKKPSTHYNMETWSDITDEDYFSIIVPDVKKPSKSNGYLSPVKIKDSNGCNVKVAVSDYECLDIADYEQVKKAQNRYFVACDFMFAQDEVFDNGDKHYKGDSINEDTYIQPGTKIMCEIYGFGYKDLDIGYYGETTMYYTVYSDSISKVRFKVADQFYTGKQIKPDISQITSDCDSFEIIGYGKNVDAGTGTVTVRGKGNYGGTRVLKFKIKPRDMGSQ